MAIALSAEYIRVAEHRRAAAAAEDAVKLFGELGDDYGVRVAQLNLVSALSGIPERKEELEQLAGVLRSATERSIDKRTEALLANLQARALRDADEPELAERESRRAIQLGEQLGDLGVIIRNSINLGNALRDQKRLDDAIAVFSDAKQLARDAKLIALEAAACELIASVLNQAERFDEALTEAASAIDLLRAGVDRHVLARAFDERANAFVGLGRHGDAIVALSEAAAALSESEEHKRFWTTLLGRALLMCRRNQADQYIGHVLDRAVPGSQGRDGSPPARYAVEGALLAVLHRAPAEAIVATAALLVEAIVLNEGVVLQRQIALRLIEAVQRAPSALGARKMLAMAGIAVAVDGSVLGVRDLARIAEQSWEEVPGVAFKPFGDGAAYWAIEITGTPPLLCVITQFDDDGLSARIAFALAAHLAGLGKQYRELVLGSAVPARSGVDISIISASEFRETIDPRGEYISVPLDDPVKTAVLVKQGDSSAFAPLAVIRRDDAPERWVVSARPVGSFHEVLAVILLRLALQFYDEQLAEEDVRPKLLEFMRELSALRFS